MNVATIDKFHKTWLGYMVFGLAEFAAAYGAVLWALDSGSLWAWLLTIILFVGFLQNAGRMAVYKK